MAQSARKANPGKKKAVQEAVEDAFNPYGNITTVLDLIEKELDISDGGLVPNEARMSTGLLCLDIVLGGGITAGWYTNFGQEQSCKTTLAVNVLFSALFSRIPILAYWDFEGSASPEYYETIMRKVTRRLFTSISEVFGEKDNKGQWVHPPVIRYRSEAVAEKFFDFLASIERKLPDKKLLGDQWYYVYEDTKPNRAIVKDKFDKSYFSKTGKLRVPAPDGSLQAIVLVDSYPAMLPEKQDVDDPNNAIATQARMFSDQLKRVKGRMRGKRIAVFGINQLRLKPMVMFGNPEYEPGGEALKLFSDVRLKCTSRAISAVDGAKGKGQIELEPSLTGDGDDEYRYVHIRAHKNKLSVPYLECFLRLWIKDVDGVAQGFDLVYDTYEYLRSTGQATGNRKAIHIHLHGQEKPFRKPLPWRVFKTLILGDKPEIKSIFTKLGLKPMLLRTFCEKQMKSGTGLDLYFAHQKAAKKAAIAKKKANPDADDEGGSEE